MAFRVVGMTGRLQTESSLHRSSSKASCSWDLQCPCPSTEYCLAQGAVGTHMSSNFISLPGFLGFFPLNFWEILSTVFPGLRNVLNYHANSALLRHPGAGLPACPQASAPSELSFFFSQLLCVWVFCLCMSVCRMHAVPGAHRGPKMVWDRDYHSHELPHGCWELNPGLWKNSQYS